MISVDRPSQLKALASSYGIQRSDLEDKGDDKSGRGRGRGRGRPPNSDRIRG